MIVRSSVVQSAFGRVTSRVSGRVYSRTEVQQHPFGLSGPPDTQRVVVVQVRTLLGPAAALLMSVPFEGKR